MKQKKQNQFLSKAIYEELVPEDSFWRRVNELIDWDDWARSLEVLYKNDKGGNPNWSPKIMLKTLLLQRVYNTSDRKTQELCTQNIMVKYFLGLEVQEEAPDYSTISKFRSAILKQYGAEFYEEFFEDILTELQKQGLKFSGTYAVDSTITDADVNTWKDKQRQEQGEEARDKDASWTAKSRPGKKGDGNNTTYYYGYKSHTLVDIEKQIITAVIPDSASPHDRNYAEVLVEKGMSVSKIKELLADSAYDDAFFIHDLEGRGVFTAIRVRRTRTNQIDYDNEGYWISYVEDQRRQELYKKRGLVERPFADQKVNHGLDRCKYLGKEKFKMQSFMTAAAYNIKVGLKLLFNTNLNMY